MLFYLVPTGERTKYYFGWNLAEAGFIASGCAYNGVDEKGNKQFTRFRNVTWNKVELGENVRQIAIYWNGALLSWIVWTPERDDSPINPIFQRPSATGCACMCTFVARVPSIRRWPRS